MKLLKINQFKKLITVYKNLSIKKKLPLVLGVQIVVPLLLMGFVSFRISENIIRTKFVNYSSDLLNSMNFSIKEYTNNLVLVSQNILYEEKIYDALNNDIVGDNSLYNYQTANEMDNIFRRLILTRSEIQGIYLVSDNQNYYVTQNSGTEEAGGLPYEEIIQKARESNGKPIWYLQKANGGVSRVFLARTVYNQDTYQEIGLLAILAKQEYLTGLCQELTNKDSQNIAIVSQDSQEIAHSDFGYRVDKQLLNNRERGAFIDKREGVLITFMVMEQPDWCILTSISLKELYQDINGLKIWVIFLGALSVALLAVLSWLIAADFLNPLNRLTQAMSGVTPDGELGCVEVDREDELGLIGKNFNSMASEINYLVKWIYKEQLTRKDAELKALQAQINPHFLFNTLETINWMAQLNGVEEISEMVSTLSTLMDMSIGRDNKLITVSEEVAYIRKYMYILQKRYDGKIRFIEKINPDVSDVKIPRLLLQPLIENAVYHGVVKKSGMGTILLKAKLSQETVVIDVIDTGVGIDNDELEMINDRLLDQKSDYFKNSNGSTPRSSVGVLNVNRRIKLFFGDQWGVTVSSKHGFFSKFTIVIPSNYDTDFLRNCQKIT